MMGIYSGSLSPSKSLKTMFLDGLVQLDLPLVTYAFMDAIVPIEL